MKFRFVPLTTSGLIAALMFVFAITPLARAADSTPRESITLSPIKQRYALDAGSTKTDELTVVNDGETGYDFIVYARPYSVHNETYDNPDFTAQTPTTDVYKWVQVSQAKYHVNAGQTVKVPYTIRVPQNAAPGGHYSVLFAETQPTDTSGGNSVVRKKRVGMIIYATINGQFQMGGHSLGTSIPFLQFHAPLTASSRVKNTGNSDFVVSSTYRITDLFGGEKYRVDKDYVVLPQTTRLMTFAWDDAPWFGLFKAELKMSFLDQNSTTTKFVLLVPRWLLIVLAVTAAGGVIYALLRRKR